MIAAARPWGLVLASALGLLGQGTLPSSKEARSLTNSPHLSCTTSCHKAHRALLPRAGTRGAAIESMCLGCHQSQTQSPTFEKAPRLPSLSLGGSSHLRSSPGARALEYSRVVRLKGGQRALLQQDCSGCHDTHGREAGRLRTEAFDSRGLLLTTKPAAFAQICFGCHAGSDAAPTRRTEPDIGLRFSASAVSRHRIGAAANDRTDLPSLRTSGFRAKLDCTSCHDNPDASGMRGPHLSSFSFLLKAAYNREKDLGQGGDRANELCLTCHDKSSILGNQSFPLHAQHITGFVKSQTAGRSGVVARAADGSGPRGSRDPRTGRSLGFMPGFGEPTPCATCHDPHGTLKNPMLIQFDRNVVGPSSVGGVDFVRTGHRQGTCTLTCHSYDHVQTRYGI